MTDFANVLCCSITIVLVFTACSSSKQLSGYIEAQRTAGTVSSNPSRSAQPDTGQKLVDAPDFTLKKANGKPFTLSDYKGQVVVINIWATWCGPCREEIPDFMELQQEMKDKGVQFVGVSLDEKGWEVVRPFIEEYQINYPIMVYDDSFFDAYGPFQGIPLTYVINRKGKIAYFSPGMTTKSRLKPVLQKIAGSS